MYICIYIYIYINFKNLYTYLHIYKHMYLYSYIYAFTPETTAGPKPTASDRKEVRAIPSHIRYLLLKALPPPPSPLRIR